MAASHFNGFWRFGQNGLPSQIKRKSWGSRETNVVEQIRIFGRFETSRLWKSNCSATNNSNWRGGCLRTSQIRFLQFCMSYVQIYASLMCRFMHVLCALQSKRTRCASTGSLCVRTASVHIYIYIYIYIYICIYVTASYSEGYWSFGKSGLSPQPKKGVLKESEKHSGRRVDDLWIKC